jgi:predicted nucleotidyltransferase
MVYFFRRLKMQGMNFDIYREAMAAICRSYRVRELSVFGSVVTGGFSATSDIDLLVEFQPDAKVGFVAFSKMQRELTSLLKRKVDLVPKSGLKPLIRQAVLSNTELLYAA